MKIREMFTPDKLVVSFEIFPPKPDYPLETIFQTLEQLKSLKPDFISVTYGAGGSSSARSIEIASRVKNVFGIETLAHLTCVGSNRSDIDAILAQLQENNIENILALRGDPPAGESAYKYDQQGYTFAKDLIAHIQEKEYFCVAAAGYPEGHLECRDLELDIKHLQAKVKQGVDLLITQLFFDNTVFYSFWDKAKKLGIKCPISVGVFPVLNAAQIKRITALCGATIPARLSRLLEKYGGYPADMEKAGIEYACEQIIDLIDNQVAGIHLYTMNKAQQAKTIMRQTGLRG